jgi:hypothetical protein
MMSLGGIENTCKPDYNHDVNLIYYGFFYLVINDIIYIILLLFRLFSVNSIQILFFNIIHLTLDLIIL